MALTETIPPYCSNCTHKSVCKIQINISDMDKLVDVFNKDNASTLQSVSSINYNCRFKTKEV